MCRSHTRAVDVGGAAANEATTQGFDEECGLGEGEAVELNSSDVSMELNSPTMANEELPPMRSASVEKRRERTQTQDDPVTTQGQSFPSIDMVDGMDDDSLGTHSGVDVSHADIEETQGFDVGDEIQGDGRGNTPPKIMVYVLRTLTHLHHRVVVIRHREGARDFGGE